MSLSGEGAAVQEEGQVRSDHHSKALCEVPVPGVCTVKLSNVVQHVKLQEVPLHKGPLGEKGLVKSQNIWKIRLVSHTLLYSAL